MALAQRLRVVLLKPTRYGPDGFVERYKRGFLPNGTLPVIRGLTPEELLGCSIEVHLIDEVVQTNLDYLRLLEPVEGARTLLALVGVQSPQIHRALDLAALAMEKGILTVMGGPYCMTCDTTELQGKGLGVALAEAELLWKDILTDAIREGALQPLYGRGMRWTPELPYVVQKPPSRQELKPYMVRSVNIYPARGCPYTCRFCSIIKIAGNKVRSPPMAAIMETIRAARAAGHTTFHISSDNFNKFPGSVELLQNLIDEKLGIHFSCQCDTELVDQEAYLELLSRAGCYYLFFGIEAFDRRTLKSVNKNHNAPERYAELARLCRRHDICSNFGTIVAFPHQTEEDVIEQLRALREVDPDLPNVFVLSPIPGTEQCDDFLDQGLLDPGYNMDLLDGSALYWKHPHLSTQQVHDLVRQGMREFLSWGRLLQRIPRLRWSRATYSWVLSWFMTRIVVAVNDKPGAPLFFSVRLDHRDEYLALRRRAFGLEQVRIPRALRLSESDQQLNREAKLVLPPLLRRASTL